MFDLTALIALGVKWLPKVWGSIKLSWKALIKVDTNPKGKL